MMSSNRRVRIYFAAPLFNEMERRFNAEIVEELERFCEVFLPQRDGGMLMKIVKEGATLEMAEACVFECDVDAMREADVVVAVLDGANVDEGVAFEIGYMFALGKKCLGFQTDFRRALPTGNNPMISRSLDRVFSGRDELLDYVRELQLPKIESVDELRLEARESKMS